MTEMLQIRLHAGYGRPVKVPRDFRVGSPSGFGWFVRKTIGMKPVPVHGLDGLWITMRGGPLPVELLARVEQADDGRWMITGLLLGLHSHREITWETLRAIKPSTLLSYLFSGFDPRSPAKGVALADPWPAETLPGEQFDLEAWERDAEDLPAVNLRSQKWRDYTRAQAALIFWQDSIGRVKSSVEPVTRPRASVAADLTAFSDAYLRHLASSPRRATTATAKELHISRATAIRRLAECRQLGLIPPSAGRS